MQVKKDSLLLRIIFYNDFAIILTSIALAVVFSLIVFSSMEQRIADTAKGKVFLLQRAYFTAAKDTQEVFEQNSSSILEEAVKEGFDGKSAKQVAEKIRYSLLKNNYQIYAKSRVLILDEQGLFLGSNAASADHWFLSKSSMLEEYRKAGQKRNSLHAYVRNNKLFFRFIVMNRMADQRRIFVILELPFGAYSMKDLRSFVALSEEDRILITVNGCYQYGDFDFPAGKEILDRRQLNRYSIKNFSYFFSQQDLGGTPYYISFYKLKNLDDEYIASIGVAISKAKFITTKRLLSALILFVVLALIVISTTICTKLFSRLLLPLNKILDAAYDIGRGNYGINLEEDSLYEWKSLSVAMERLAKNIALQKNQLYQNNKNLKRNLMQIDAIQKIVMGVNLSKEFDQSIQGILSAFTSEAGLGYSRAIYFEHNREKNKLEAKFYAVNQFLYRESKKETRTLKTFAFQLEDLDRLLPLLKSDCSVDNYLGRSILEGKILYENDKGYHFNFGNDLFHSLALHNFIVLPLANSDHKKSCILLDYYCKEQLVSQEEIELLTLLLLNLKVQLKNREGEEKKLYQERGATMEKIALHFLKDKKHRLERMQAAIDKVEKNSYNEKIVLEEISRMNKDFGRFHTDYQSLEEFADFTRSDYEIFSINSFMEDFAKSIEERMEKYEINYSQFVSCSGEIYGDRRKLKRAFLELVRNAEEAILSRNRLNKKINIVVMEDRKSNQFIITIVDNGIGMYPEEVEGLNQAYASHLQNEYMGLGLSLVSMVIREHSGDLHVTSVLDEGTDIKIILNKYKGEQHE